MTKQEFIAEFVLRAMTQIQVLEASDENWYLRVSVRLAHEAWNAMNTYEQKPVGISKELVALAEKALSEYKDGKYIAQDDKGYWAVYKSKPVLNQSVEGLWREGLAHEASYVFHKDNPPADYTQECYEIAIILGTKN